MTSSQLVMHYFCEPYFHAIHAWNDYDDTTVLVNRIQLIAAIMKILAEDSHSHVTFRIEGEIPNIPLLSPVTPTAGEHYRQGFDIKAFKEAKKIVDDVVFLAAGNYFQHHMLRPLAIGNQAFMLSNQDILKCSAIKAMATTFRLPQSCGFARLHSSITDKSGVTKTSEVPLHALQGDALNLSVALLKWQADRNSRLLAQKLSQDGNHDPMKYENMIQRMTDELSTSREKEEEEKIELQKKLELEMTEIRIAHFAAIKQQEQQRLEEQQLLEQQQLEQHQLEQQQLEQRLLEQQEQQSRHSAAPAEFLCQISNELMVDPVMLPDGYTYERANILNWLEKSKIMSRIPTSPKTGEELDQVFLIPNNNLRILIDEYRPKISSGPGEKLNESKEPVQAIAKPIVNQISTKVVKHQDQDQHEKIGALDKNVAQNDIVKGNRRTTDLHVVVQQAVPHQQQEERYQQKMHEKVEQGIGKFPNQKSVLLKGQKNQADIDNTMRQLKQNEMKRQQKEQQQKQTGLRLENLKSGFNSNSGPIINPNSYPNSNQARPGKSAAALLLAKFASSNVGEEIVEVDRIYNQNGQKEGHNWVQCGGQHGPLSQKGSLHGQKGGSNERSVDSKNVQEPHSGQAKHVTSTITSTSHHAFINSNNSMHDAVSASTISASSPDSLAKRRALLEAQEELDFQRAMTLSLKEENDERIWREEYERNMNKQLSDYLQNQKVGSEDGKININPINAPSGNYNQIVSTSTPNQPVYTPVIRESSLKTSPPNSSLSATRGKTLSVLCPSSRIGLVIGTRGVIIKRIMSHTNTRIDHTARCGLYKEQDANNLNAGKIIGGFPAITIYIKGTEVACAEAEQMINLIIAGGPNAVGW